MPKAFQAGSISRKAGKRLLRHDHTVRPDAEGCVRNDVNKAVYVNQNGVFQCGLGHWEYVFNVHTKRFLAFYLSGYVDGDKTGDTPSVEGGTCTKRD